MEALAAVDCIASALLQPGLLVSASLAGGSAGVALFFSFLSFLRPEVGERVSEEALELLGHSIDAVADHRQSPSLYSGFTGIAWAVQQCRVLVSQDEDPNTDIDDALGAYLAQGPWRGAYDLISGLVGYGLYGLERHKASLLGTVIDRLSETAVIKPDGVTWFTPAYLLPEWQRSLYPEGYYNLGLAHGVPGVIALLAQACAEGVSWGKARPLLDGAVRWLLSKKNPDGNDYCFANLLRGDGAGSEGPSSRLAWCYGDLGISAALLWAARSVDEPSWEREAIDIAKRAARRPVAQSGVKDAGLCHGSAGNGHLFNRLYQATREQVFLDAARDWFSWTLAFRQPGKGVGGFLAWRNLHGVEWEALPGLLEGAAGIGLALIAAVSSVRPDWDRMLLVSVPPR